MPGTAVVTIRGNQWNVEVASTTTELITGLSGRASLLAKTGMLFDLGSERLVTVNAYEMLFPIDVVFISESLKVTEFALLAPGEDVTTSVPCRYFLETNIGEIDSVEVGDQVIITGYTPTTGTTSSIIELMVTMLIVSMMMKMMMTIVKEVK